MTTSRMNKATHRQDRRRRSILTASVSTLCVLSVLFAAPSLSLSSNEPLTTEDKKSLMAGELVMKQKNEQRGAHKLIGGQSWQIIEVPIEVAWEAMMDLTGYKNFIPLATETNITHRAGEEADLAVRQEWGPIDVRYVLQTTLESDKRSLVFRVDHSKDHDIRAGWGFLRIRPFKGNRTLVSFGALVDIGDGVFVSIIRPAVRRDLLRIPYYFKRHIETEVARLESGSAL